MRRLTRFDFSVTKRGSGRPLGPLAACAAARSAVPAASIRPIAKMAQDFNALPRMGISVRSS